VEIPRSFMVACTIAGVLLAFLLWWWLGLPSWAIPLVALASPLIIVGVLLLAFTVIWMASGSH
jgi:hypothetical protein